MARGSQAKIDITNKILETFEGAFQYDKEIRIPIQENGELVQIKVTLTAAKVNVESGSDTSVPSPAAPTKEVKKEEITEQEKKETADLLASLNL